MKVNVLGTEYTVTFKSDEDVCAAMNVQIGECGGYCNVATKEIVIANLNTTTDSEAEKDVIKKSSLRHEAGAHWMRRKETQIRTAKDEQSALKAAGDTLGAREAGKKSAALQKEYRAFCDHVGLTPRYERTRGMMK